MGNAPATLAVQLDKNAYTSGEFLTGKIYLNVTSATKCNTLQLELHGYEKTKVKYKRKKNKETETRYARATRTFLRVDTPIASFPDGTAKPGQFEFPFTAKLPEGLPSTMKCGNASSWCKVFYFVKARLHRYVVCLYVISK